MKTYNCTVIRHIGAVGAVALLAAFGVSTVYASNLTWNTGSGDWDYSTPNWTGGATTYTDGDAVTFDDSPGGTADITVNMVIYPYPSSITVNNSVLDYIFDGSGAISTGPLIKNGSAKLTVAMDNSFTEGTVINAGTICIGSGGDTGNLGTGNITDNGTLQVNRTNSVTISQNIVGTGSLELVGTGSVTLSGTNTFSGGTTFSAGTVVIGIASVNSGTTVVSGATGAGDVTIADGVTFTQTPNRWDAAKVTLLGDITLGGDLRQQVAFRTLDLSGGTRTIHLNATGGFVRQTIPGDFALEGTGRNRWETIDLSDTHPYTYAAPPTFTVTNGNLVLDYNQTDDNYVGFMFQFPSSFANNVGLTVGTNVYLQTWIEGALGSTPEDTAKLTVNGIWTLMGSTVAAVAGTNQFIYSLAGSGRVCGSMMYDATNPRKMWILGTSGSTEFSGRLIDGPDGTGTKLSLAKTGGSTQILSGTNTYSGSTTISGGTLALSGESALENSTPIEIGTGATLDVSGRADQTFTLNSGQTVMASGAIDGNLVVPAGSTLILGSPIGTLTVSSNVTLGSSLTMELDRGNTPTSDQIVSQHGTFTGGGMLTVTNVGAQLRAGDVFHLFSGPVSGFSSVDLATTDATGGTYTWTNKLAMDGTIEVLTAPTPSPAPIEATLAGNQLMLSWPAGLHWNLQVQTNALDEGIGTNWVTIPNSDSLDGYTNTIDPTQGSVFYRLVYP